MKDMEDIFTKFYSNYIQEIHDFLNSNSDILYISGYAGSGKSSTLKNALKAYRKDILNFHHICFPLTSTDDFLLSFYDSFREHAMKGKIELNKNPEEAFLNKVNYYFNSLQYPAVVVIDNYELIQNNSEINDFLLHISGLENVKVIIVSKNNEAEIAQNPTVSVERLDFGKIPQDEFFKVIKNSFQNLSDDCINNFYNCCEGYELYIKMSLTYIESINGSINELMEEFKNKDISYSDFIIEKQISLIPNNYYSILQNFACINHNVSSKFMEVYSLGDTKQLPYLFSKYAISEFFETYYIKSYLRNYFIENVSLQDKISLYSNIISVYENELKKSLKDRLLRLSRDTIRKLISSLEEITPKVKKIVAKPSFNYVAQAINSNPQWFVTGATNKNMSGLDKLRKQRDEREKLKAAKPEEKKENKSELAVLLEKVSDLEKSYKYKEALRVLKNEAYPLAQTYLDKKKVYIKSVENHIKLNDNHSALYLLKELFELSKENDDFAFFAECKLKSGQIYKKMYSLQMAKSCYNELISYKSNVPQYLLARAKMGLAEIYEMESSFEDSINEYNQSRELIVASKGNTHPLLPEISYKIASIYEEIENYDEAYNEYQNSINYSGLSNNDKYLIKCYSASGLILADRGEIDQAISSLEFAFELSKSQNSYLDSYYAARSIAQIYRDFEPNKSYEYLLSALEYARYSENSFETAISLLELGDFYYNTKQNEQALICYFQAKKLLGNSASKENTDIVLTRINDMKIRLGNYVFEGMKALYDSN